MGAVIGGTLLDIMQLKLILFFIRTNFSELTILFPDHLKILRKKNELYALVLPFNKMKIGIPEALSKGMYNYNLLTRDY
jgi:NTE family protein